MSLVTCYFKNINIKPEQKGNSHEPQTRELIQLFKEKNKPITAKELSAYLDVSIRTVKSYVSYINNEAGSTLIVSSTYGYELNTEITEVFSKKGKESGQLPQHYEERANYINKVFLLNHIDKLNIYDLSEEMYVSPQTIKNDISRMNKSFLNFNVKYLIKGDYIHMKADEKHIRRLARFTLFETANSGMIDYSVLKETFPDIDIDLLKNIIGQVFFSNNLYINDFSKANMILHLAIIIRRIRQQNFITLQQQVSLDHNILESQAMQQLCEQMESAFDIILSNDEKNNIFMLFKSCANISLSSNADDIYNYTGLELVELTAEIVQKIKDFYYVDLNNEKFQLPFLLHLKNLLFRMENNFVSINPMCEAIRFSSPLIFDIAVFAALILEEKTGKKIDENEISYLALHIGGEIERQTITDEKISIVLLCPQYLEYESKTYNFLLMNFSNEIEIIASVNTLESAKKYEFDLLVTPLPIDSEGLPFKVCNISLFQDSRDRIQIERAIEKIKDRTNTNILRESFDHVFDERLFFIDQGGVDNKQDIMKKMAGQMYQLGYVHDDFLSRVIERDCVMSTAFPNIAIPHSMKMDAIKTSICVMICPKGVQWDDQRVYLVFMVAIHKVDCLLFREIYESLVKLFDNERSIRYLIESTEFNAFKNRMLALIQ